MAAASINTTKTRQASAIVLGMLLLIVTFPPNGSLSLLQPAADRLSGSDLEMSPCLPPIRVSLCLLSKKEQVKYYLTSLQGCVSVLA